MCEIDLDCDPWEFESVRTVKRGRKPVRCDGCGTMIPVGAPRDVQAWKGDGYFNVENLCFACSEVFEAFTVEHGIRFNFGSLTEQLVQCIESGEGDDWIPVLEVIRQRNAAARDAERAVPVPA